MGWQEYGLLALVIIIPLTTATIVTLWTLEQARMRSKKNRKRAKVPRQAAEPPGDSG